MTPSIDYGRDALLLDIDGTIIDIAPAPEAVRVPESLKRDLSRARERLGGALALVSGRTIANIDKLFAPLEFATAGCHGAELRSGPGNAIERGALPMDAAEKAEFASLARLNPRILVEDKIYSLAVHYRRTPELKEAIIAAVSAHLRKVQRDLEIAHGKAVVEIKPPGFDKGTGLRRIMAGPPFAGRHPIFLGDDITDEDAFAAVAEFGGTGLAVGDRPNGVAKGFRSPREVRRWLASLAAA